MSTNENDLAVWIKRRMAEVGLEHQKALAGRIHDRLPDLGLDTVTTKLSKLLNGSAEGERFFAVGERGAALAAALQVAPEVLDREREAAAAIRTLVLDPRLDEATRNDLVARCAAPERVGALRCVTAEGASPAEALRDTAAAVSSPLLVLYEDQDPQPFDLLRLPWTKLAWRPRGWVLAQAPELLPEPPPPPPKLFDDDGNPLVPVSAEDLVRLRARYLPHEWEMNRAHERGETFPLPLAEALAWLAQLEQRYGLRISCVDRHDLPAEALCGGLVETLVWSESGRVLALGRDTAWVREALAPWHPVHSPPWTSLWAEVTGSEVNPWQLVRDLESTRPASLPAWWASVEPAVAWAKPGDRDPTAKTWVERHGPSLRHHARRWAEERQKVLLEQARRDGDGLVANLGAPAGAVREALAALAARPVFDGMVNVRLGLLLRHVAERRLELLPVREPDQFRVVADLGGPQLVFLRFRRLGGRPEPFRQVLDHHAAVVYEGGDGLLTVQRIDAHLPRDRDTGAN